MTGSINVAERLERCAKRTGLDAVAELLTEAAATIRREVEARQSAQIQLDALQEENKRLIARALNAEARASMV